MFGWSGWSKQALDMEFPVVITSAGSNLTAHRPDDAVIGHVYPIEDMIAAYRHVELGRKKGNAVISLI